MDEKKIEKWECVSKKMTALCKKGFSPRNLKKGAAVVVLVAVAAGAGKVTLKKMRFDRRQAEAAAKVELAQKLAVERNEPLLSSDEVLGKIAIKIKKKGIMIASSSKKIMTIVTV